MLYNLHNVKLLMYIVHGTCEKGQYRCWNGQCISSYRVCDGYRDCSDGLDESDEACNETSCKLTYLVFVGNWNI